MSRTKNAVRNILGNGMYKVVSIFLPFLVQTVMIYVLGVEYIGLSSLYSSVLGVLSLAELGIGEALVYSMYKPVEKSDVETVCALLSLYRKWYRIIGCIMLGVGLAISPFLDFFITGEYPEGINIYLLYYIYLFNTTISYWLFAYKKSLFLAFQRVDIASNIDSVIVLSRNLIQIIVLFITKNFYFYALTIPITSIANNILYEIFAKKSYPQYSCRGRVSKELTLEIKKNIKGLLFQKIGNTIFTSVDSIVISSFLGLKILGLYSNYLYVVKMLSQFIGVFSSALTPIIGNCIVTESKEKNYDNLRKFNFMETWILSWMTCCLIALYQPFMELWAGNQNLLDFDIAVLFAVYFYTFTANDCCYIFRQATGIWWEGRYMLFFSSALNLGLNLGLVRLIGVRGILLSTILSVILINIPWGTRVLFKNYFDDLKKEKLHLGSILIYAMITTVVCIVNYWVCSFIEGNRLVVLIIRLIISITVPNVLFLMIYCKTDIFKHVLGWINEKRKTLIK